MLPNSIQKIINGMVEVREGKVMVVVENNLKEKWDELVWQAVWGKEEEKQAARWLIWEVGQFVGVKPASINDLYAARGRGEIPLDFTVPAINIRAMAYDVAKAVFRQAKKLKVGALSLELARSEISYTNQSVEEYVAVVLAAAIREDWRGPLYIQADHFQAKASGPGEPKEGEIEAIKQLTQEAVKAGFYNIDIDMSTLVDLERKTETEQQEYNINYSLEMAKFIRELEPKGVTVSIGGEIGHIGGKNSTIEDMREFVKGFNKKLPEGMAGMSKISVATGTHHGGVVLPDGSLADVPVDFKVLADISKACRAEFQISGAVQHGASTLPDEFFAQFPKTEAIEIHLATGFQNIILDHPSFPKDFLEEMYAWLDKEKIGDKKEGQTNEQFHYSERKKTFGQFKKGFWEIEKGVKDEIMAELEKRFEFMYKELKVINTQEMVKKVSPAMEIHKTLADFGKKEKTEEVGGLAD